MQQTTGINENEMAANCLAGAALLGVELPITERKRVEAVVESLASARGEGESLAEVAHDARNMVTALGLYCDLLEEPGVLNPPFGHYGSELRLVATASRSLVEKMMALDLRMGPAVGLSRSIGVAAARMTADPLAAGRQESARRWEMMPSEPIGNLSGEVLANRNLLAALAGPSITLTVDAMGGEQPVRLTGEDLTRILVNLIKNAAEAMPDGGNIQLGLHEFHAETGASADRSSSVGCETGVTAQWLVLTVKDDGPGIPKKALDKIFESGYTTHSMGVFRHGGWPASHRGLGLSITRSIVEAAGGSIHASNRLPSGACFKIELPIRTR
jgi:two-component system cell cycle sensor histidine kinase/response regulator CckA